jgi:hypothetical protein
MKSTSLRTTVVSKSAKPLGLAEYEEVQDLS